MWGSGQQDVYDQQKANWGRIAQLTGLPGPWGQGKAAAQQQGPAANDSNAEQENTGAEEQASMNAGFGRIVINGEPGPTINDIAVIENVRPGVDGPYIIAGVEHNFSRHGFITYLDVWPKLFGAADAAAHTKGIVDAQGMPAIHPPPPVPGLPPRPAAPAAPVPATPATP